jgi:hypothetical protein
MILMSVTVRPLNNAVPSTGQASKNSARRTLGWALVLCLLVLASTEFMLRGPVRFARARDFNDFISPYIQTRLLLTGMDPYGPTNLVAFWPTDAVPFAFLKRDLADGSLVLKRGIPTAYPLTSWVVLAPIAWLPWHVAYRIWLVVTVLAFGLAAWSLITLLGFRWHEMRTYLFLALALALAPVHTGLAAGSIVIVVVGLCAIAVLAADREWNITSGVLIGIAVALKPQIGLPFLAYYLIRRRWSIATTAVALLAVLASIAIFQLMESHTPWIESYRYNSRTLFAHGSLGDFTESNPIRFSLVNLQVLLYTFLPDRAWANSLAILTVGLLGLLWLLLAGRCADTRNELLALGALTVLSLLPVYHRLYDATLLIFPLAWSVAEFHKDLARKILLLLLVFLVPGGSALEQLQNTNRLVTLQHSTWWTRIVMPHQVWALLFLTVLLLAGMRACAANLPTSSGDPA